MLALPLPDRAGAPAALRSMSRPDRPSKEREGRPPDRSGLICRRPHPSRNPRNDPGMKRRAVPKSAPSSARRGPGASGRGRCADSRSTMPARHESTELPMPDPARQSSPLPRPTSGPRLGRIEDEKVVDVERLPVNRLRALRRAGRGIEARRRPRPACIDCRCRVPYAAPQLEGDSIEPGSCAGAGSGSKSSSWSWDLYSRPARSPSPGVARNPKPRPPQSHGGRRGSDAVAEAGGHADSSAAAGVRRQSRCPFATGTHRALGLGRGQLAGAPVLRPACEPGHLDGQRRPSVRRSAIAGSSVPHGCLARAPGRRRAGFGSLARGRLRLCPGGDLARVSLGEWRLDHLRVPDAQRRASRRAGGAA